MQICSIEFNLIFKSSINITFLDFLFLSGVLLTLLYTTFFTLLIYFFMFAFDAQSEGRQVLPWFHLSFILLMYSVLFTLNGIVFLNSCGWIVLFMVIIFNYLLLNVMFNSYSTGVSDRHQDYLVSLPIKCIFIRILVSFQSERWLPFLFGLAK